MKKTGVVKKNSLYCSFRSFKSAKYTSLILFKVANGHLKVYIFLTALGYKSGGWRTCFGRKTPDKSQVNVFLIYLFSVVAACRRVKYICILTGYSVTFSVSRFIPWGQDVFCM